MSIENKLPPDWLYFSEHIPSALWNLVVAASAIIIGLIIKLIITLLLKRYSNKELSYSFFQSILTRLGGPITYFIPLFMLNLGLPLMKISKAFLSPLDRATDIALTICFSAILVRSVRVFEDYIYHAYDLNKTDNLKERKIRTQIQFIRKLLIIGIIFITVSLILLSFSSLRKIGTGLLTGVGIVSIFIGLAAQNSLGNLLAGFQIAFTQPMRIDDVLVVEGEWGRVEDITLTYVVMRLWDQRRLILPINYFIQKPFQNWTRISADIVGTVFLYMDYTIPLEELRTEFNRLMDTSPIWDKRVKAMQVTDAKNSNIEIRFLVSASNSSDAFDLRCYIREHLITFIRDNYPESLPKVRAEIESKENVLPAVNHPLS